MTMQRALGGVVLSAAVAALAACSNGGAGLKVSASTANAPGAGQGRASLQAGEGITIERLRMVVRKVEVERYLGPGDGCPVPPSADDDGPGDDSGGSGGTTGGAAGTPPTMSLAHGGDDDGDECEIEGGPFLVDLSGADLASGVHWVAEIDIPAGTWHEVEFKINTIPAGKAGDDAGLAEMADLHASIAVDGTMDGAPFTFTTPMEVKQEREGEIVVDPETGANVTLDVDPSGWFTAPDGSRLDPTDPTDQGAILANIRASIRVMHDDDGDGHDDDHDHGGDGGRPDDHGGSSGPGSGAKRVSAR